MDIFVLILFSIIISLPIGIISFFIVNKELGFLAEGIAHISFGGLAIGIVLNISPFWVGTTFSVLSGLIIGFLVIKSKISENLFIGVFLSFSMSLGVILIKLSNNYGVDLFSYLFGSMLNVDTSKLPYIALFSILIVLLFLFFRKKIIGIIFDPVFLKIKGIKIEKIYYGIMIVISFSIIYLIKIMGIIMISGTLIIPGLTGLFISKNYKTEVLLSIISSFLMISLGIILSYSYSFLPTGPSVIIVGFIVLILSAIFNKIKKVR